MLLHDPLAAVGMAQQVDALDAKAVLGEQVLPQVRRQDPHLGGQWRIVPEPDELLAWHDLRGRAAVVQVGVQERKDQRSPGAQAVAERGQGAVRVEERQGADGVRGIEGLGLGEVVDQVCPDELHACNVRVSGGGALVLGGRQLDPGDARTVGLGEVHGMVACAGADVQDPPTRELPLVLAMPAGAEKAAAVEGHAKQLREAYGPFTRACDVMVVDAGNSVAEAVPCSRSSR